MEITHYFLQKQDRILQKQISIESKNQTASNEWKLSNIMNPKVKGYILGAISAITYGLNPLFALPLYADGMDANSVLLFRYCLGIPMVAAMIIFRRRSFAIEKKTFLPIVLMGVLMAISSLSLFEAYNHMPAAIASTLLFVYPLMVALIMALFFRERLTIYTSVCILMALTGIGLLFNNPGGSLSVIGTLLVMLSSLSYAIYIVGVNRPLLKPVPTLKMIFYVLVFGAVVIGLKILLTPEATIQLPAHWWSWGNILGLAFLPTVVSFVCTTSAIQYIGPTPTAILGALEPVTAVAIGVLVFREVMLPKDWVGLVMIITAVTMVVAAGKISESLLRFRKMFPSLRHRRGLKN